MERYFILMIIVTLVGVTVRKENRQETNFLNTRMKEKKMIGSIPGENSVSYTNFLTTYSKLKTSSDVVNEEKIYEIVDSKNSIQKIIKSWSRQVNKMSRSENPRILFNILSSLPMGEPYFIQ